MGKSSKKKSAKNSALEGMRDAVGKDSLPEFTKKEYERQSAKLQVELVNLQEWVKVSGARIVVIFEGRDAAGKGGVIRRLTERVSPRVFRVVALPAPMERAAPPRERRADSRAR